MNFQKQGILYTLQLVFGPSHLINYLNILLNNSVDIFYKFFNSILSKYVYPEILTFNYAKITGNFSAIDLKSCEKPF